MPLYEYQCRECGHNFEARQKFSDEPLSECPNCGEPTGLFRVVQAAGVVFKGSGFYVTDSRGGRENLTSTPKKKDDSSKSENADSAAASTSSAPATSAPAPSPAI